MDDLGAGLSRTESDSGFKNGWEMIWQANSKQVVLPLGHADNCR
jgi:hypothetical protein